MTTKATEKPSSTLHHRLTNKEWLTTVSQLTFAQVKILYYLKTLDPFGDRKLVLSVSKIGQELSLNKSTVSRGLKKLDSQGLISLDLLQVGVKVNCCPQTTVMPPGNDQDLKELPTGNGGCLQETIVAPRQQAIPTGNDQRLEPAASQGSTTPHTLSTSSNLNQTLSLEATKDERERPEGFKGIEPEPDLRAEQGTDSLPEDCIFPASCPEENAAGLHSLASLLPHGTQKISKQIDPEGQGSAPPAPEFLNWVIEKVKKFPSPPVFPHSAAIALINRDREALEAEYQAHLVRYTQSPEASPYTLPPKPNLEDEESRRQYKLAALKGMWQVESLRPRVAQECQEWDFELLPDGPREIAF